MRRERAVVRGGVVIMAVLAAIAVVSCFLPGFRVTEVDNSDCMDRVLDWHGGGRRAPCEVTRRDLGTEPAGSPELALVLLLVMAPAYAVWRRGTAWASLAWGAAVWGAAIALLAFAVLTHESSSDGCSGTYTVREALLPAVVLGATSTAMFFGPMLLAAVAAVARAVDRRRAGPRIPEARVRRTQ